MVNYLLIKGKYFLALWSVKGISRPTAAVKCRGGKSGQHRVPYFLTGRQVIGNDHLTASATENIPPGRFFVSGKGEKVE